MLGQDAATQDAGEPTLLMGAWIPPGGVFFFGERGWGGGGVSGVACTKYNWK